MSEESSRSASARILPVEPLTREAFAPYGQVIDCEGVTPVAINDGTALKFADLARVELVDGGEAAIQDAAISIYRARPRSLPMPLLELERHPLGSQTFMPLQAARYLVVVAGSADEPRPGDVRLFEVSGQRGVHLRPSVWHHALLALDREGEFLVVDRSSPERNLERVDTASWRLTIDA